MRQREDVLDLRRHPASGLASALVLGLQALSLHSDRGLAILLGERQVLPAEAVRALTLAHAHLMREGRRCVLVMTAAGAIPTTLAHRVALPWVATHEEACRLLGRGRPRIRVRRYDAGQTLRATLHGELDGAGVHAVGADLDALAAFARPQQRIVFDLGDLDFADAHGLEALTRTVVRAQLAGADVRVANASAQLRALACRLDWHRQLPGLVGAEPRPGRPPTPTAVIATDMSGTVVYWDEAARNLYGWSGGEVLGRDITALTVHPTDARLAETIMDEVRGRGAWEGHFSVRHRNADGFDAHVRNATVDDALGTPVGLIGYSVPAGRAASS